MEKVTEILYSVIFNAWDRLEIDDAQMEEMADALGRDYKRHTICTEVAQKLTEDLKFERRMGRAEERETVAS